MTGRSSPSTQCATAPDGWAPLPQTDDPVQAAEYAKLRYHKQLEADLEHIKAALERDTAVHTASLERAKGEQQAQIATAKAALDTELAIKEAEKTAEISAQQDTTTRFEARRSAHYAPHYTLHQAIVTSYISAATAAIERAQKRAEYIEKGATAIAALYTGVLSLAFFVKDDIDTSNPLPSRGVWAVVFLGMAIALSVGYMAFMTRSRGTAGPTGVNGLREQELEDMRAYLRWADALVSRRRNFLQAAVVSMGIGVAFLPVAFLDVQDDDAKRWAIIGAIIVAIVFALSIPAEWAIHRLRRTRET